MTVSAQVVTQSVRDGIPTSRGVSATTLDALALLGSGTLESMFAVAAPVTLEELQGHPRGRALARPHITAPWLVDVLRSAHASTLFPWEGKSFHFRAGEKEGAGINRVRLGVDDVERTERALKGIVGKRLTYR